MTHTFSITEDERQAVILAMSELAAERPGWVDYLRGIAAKLGGEEMFDVFRDSSDLAD